LQFMHWDLLADLPDAELRRLVSGARRRRFERREVVYHQGDPGDSLHLIRKGRFAVRVMTPLGETVTVAIRGPGDVFGAMMLFDEGRGRSATILALSEAETFAIYKSDFERLRAEQPAVTEALLHFLAREVRGRNERLLEALYVSAERRLLRRLVELAELYAEAPDGPTEIPLTQEDLAELAGTSRATVNRVLRAEQARRSIALGRGRTTILDAATIARRGR
jgi:CRP/FNR family cyclic AMP-dependent transcriptional regulator